MMSRGVGSVFALIHDEHRGYPGKLFTLLREGPGKVAAAADSICQDRPCLQDPFTTAFRARFRAKDELMSDSARFVLVAIGLLARTDTQRIECRHASVRRGRDVVSQTHMQGFFMASAGF